MDGVLLAQICFACLSQGRFTSHSCYAATLTGAITQNLMLRAASRLRGTSEAWLQSTYWYSTFNTFACRTQNEFVAIYRLDL
jgi:hypothetical protein